MEKYTLSLQNKKLWEFYNENKHLNFEMINILFVDFIKNISQNLSSSLITTTIQNELLNSIKDLQSQIYGIKENISSLSTTFSSNFHSINNEYIDNIKHIIRDLSSENSNNVLLQLNDMSKDFLNKITELSPNDDLYNKIEPLIKSLESEIVNDIKSNDYITHEKLMKNIEEKIQISQNPIISIIATFSDNLNNNINQIKNNDINRNTTFENLNNFINKTKYNSANKGNYGEAKLSNVIRNLFPEANIINTSGQTGNGDIILERTNKPTILFENKEYTANVPKPEVVKFINDTNNNNCSGILLSNTSGIVNKSNFQIEITNNNVLVYVHKAEYDEVLIKSAIDIIDNLYNKIELLESGDNNIGVNRDSLENIKNEYLTFVNTKRQHMKLMKENFKAITDSAQSLCFNEFKSLLEKYYPTEVFEEKFICRYEGCYSSYTSVYGRENHERSHKKNNDKKKYIDDNSSIDNNEFDETDNNNCVEIKQPPEKIKKASKSTKQKK
jgi:hypothetical protein